MENETTKWLEFRKGGQATVEQMLGSAERKKFRRAGLEESESGIHLGKLTICRSSETENLNGVH